VIIFLTSLHKISKSQPISWYRGINRLLKISALAKMKAHHR